MSKYRIVKVASFYEVHIQKSHERPGDFYWENLCTCKTEAEAKFHLHQLEKINKGPEIIYETEF